MLNRKFFNKLFTLDLKSFSFGFKTFYDPADFFFYFQKFKDIFFFNSLDKDSFIFFYFLDILKYFFAVEQLFVLDVLFFIYCFFDKNFFYDFFSFFNFKNIEDILYFIFCFEGFYGETMLEGSVITEIFNPEFSNVLLSEFAITQKFNKFFYWLNFFDPKDTLGLTAYFKEYVGKPRIIFIQYPFDTNFSTVDFFLDYSFSLFFSNSYFFDFFYFRQVVLNFFIYFFKL